MSDEEEKEKWIPAHERAIELLESDPDEHWGTLYFFYQEAKVPEEDREDVLETFRQYTPAVPMGLKKQKEFSEEDVPAHERAIQLLKIDPNEHWRTLWAMYQKAKVPEEAQGDLLETFCQNAPSVPVGLKEQAEESEKKKE